jgi:hypothetical protein
MTATGRPLESPPPGEDEAIRLIVESLKRTVRRAHPPSKVMRGAHPKLHACLRAEFTVDADVPDELRHGLFSEARTYQALVRFSNSFPGVRHDAKRDVRGCAIKLFGVDAPHDHTQDFVLTSHPTFFIRNPVDYVAFCLAVEQQKLLSGFFGLKPFRCRFQELYTLVRSQIRIKNPLGIPYYSQTPYCLGPLAVKYSIRPSGFEPNADGKAIQSSRKDFLRENTSIYLASHDALFDFLVQVQTDPDRMPIEDAVVRWDERLSPFRRVATIKIPTQTFDTATRHTLGENLSFSPWHASSAHRPLGGINRARRAVYDEISRLRHELNAAPDPGSKDLGNIEVDPPRPVARWIRRRSTAPGLLTVAALLLIIGAVASLLLFTGGGPALPENAPKPPSSFGLNGLDPVERAEYYHLTEGGEVYPMRMLLALEVETPAEADRTRTFRPFLENPERFGLIPDPASTLNPYGLPVGLTVGRSVSGVQEMGFNCAACHVGEIHYHGRRFRVDGAPNMVFINRFIERLAEETDRTLKDPVRSARFIDRMRRVKLVPVPRYPQADVVGQHYSQPYDENRDTDADLLDSPSQWKLLNRLRGLVRSSALIEAKIATLRAMPTLQAALSSATVDGYGRADAFGVGRIELFGSDPLNAQTADAPVSFPHLWGMKVTRWLQWGANTNSVIERNVGQALGVGATYQKDTYDSSVRLDHLWRMEELSYKLEPPKWPTEILGPIDEEKRKRGQAFFDRTCALCHETYTKVGALNEYQLFPLNVAATDPNTALNFERSVRTAHGVQPFPQAAFEIVQNVVRRYYEFNRIPDETQAAWEMRELRPLPQLFRAPLLQHDQFDDTRGRRVYRAKTLRGIWATAPYLHNGSVPTIYDLLLPAAKRPKSFKLGTREYDPIRLGYQTGPAQFVAPPELEPFELDTTLPGNWNSGHEWWFYDELERDDSKRYDVIEFLKSFDLPNEQDYHFTRPDKLPDDVRIRFPPRNEDRPRAH